MNKNILIVLAGGFLIAVLVAIILQSSLGGSKKQSDAERIEILVAAKDLKVGRELQEGDLKWKSWPKDGMFPGAIIRDGEQSSLEAAHGKLLRSLSSGQPMHMTLVIQDNKGDFLSANISKGMRAVGIPVKSHVLAERLIRPGDFVDVMVTYKVRVNTKTNPEAQSLVNTYATETVIENARVLAIDNDDTKVVDELDGDDKKSKSKTKTAKTGTLTLEVSPTDSEKLVLANKMGEIGIALRSIGDNSNPDSDRTTTDVGLSKVMKNLSTMSGVSSTVRIYNGDKMEEAKARQATVNNTIDFDVQDTPVEEQNIVIAPSELKQIDEE